MAVVYLYDTHRQSDASAAIHGLSAARIDSCSVAARRSEPGSRVRRDDREPVPRAGLEQTGRFKVFRHPSGFWDEFCTYHCKDGRLVKEHDDLMSATRYGLMMLRYARTEDQARGRSGGPKIAHGVDYDPLAGARDISR